MKLDYIKLEIYRTQSTSLVPINYVVPINKICPPLKLRFNLLQLVKLRFRLFIVT